jgi:hypothetical protein
MLAVSQDLGHEGGTTLELEQLTSLFEMYGNAIDELVAMGDTRLQPLLEELVSLRASMLGALTQLGPSLTN